jgi:hypothetical protein
MIVWNSWAFLMNILTKCAKLIYNTDVKIYDNRHVRTIKVRCHENKVVSEHQ